MAAAGIGNPLGFVPVLDGGVPRIIGGYAMTNISGGVFVRASGAADTISSGANSFIATDLKFAGDASGALVTGIALNSAGSNTEIAIVTRGACIVTCNGTVTAGNLLKVDGNNAVANAGSDRLAADMVNSVVGRALTDATSGGYCICDLKC